MSRRNRRAKRDAPASAAQPEPAGQAAAQARPGPPRRGRAYEAASHHDGWRPRRGGASANTDHRADATALRNKARALEQNVPYIQRGFDSLVSATIGTGIELASTAVSDRVRAVLNERLEQWRDTCDFDRVNGLDALFAVAYRAQEVDGEVLIRRRTRRGPGAALKLQLLEIDWLDSLKFGETNAGARIINGIQYSSDGDIQGYWLFESHPGDQGWMGGVGTSKLVPASEIIHLYAPKRPGASRGITRLAALISRVRDMQTYEDAELQRKNIEPRIGILASGSPDADPGNYPGMSPPASGGGAGGDEFLQAYADENAEEISSGGVTYLPHGMNITPFEPQSPPGFVEYMGYNLHLVAAAMGVPYESITGDMRRVNFSSARIRQMEFRRDVEQMQWLHLVPRLIKPIWGWFVESVQLETGIAADTSLEISMPRWDYVNPKQDIEAEIAAIGAGLMSPSESLRRRGYKPERVFAEIASDYAALEASGAIKLLQFMANRGAPAPEPQANPADDDDDSDT